MKDKNEEIFVNKVENILIKNGFNTWREVIPNECKLWDRPYRVDLIFYRNDIGYIGVEAKNIHSLRQGSIIAKATEQIKKYRNLTYFDNIKINRWCLGIKTSLKDYDGIQDTERNILNFVQYFLGYYNIDILFSDEFISISPYTKKVLYIPERRINN